MGLQRGSKLEDGISVDFPVPSMAVAQAAYQMHMELCRAHPDHEGLRAIFLVWEAVLKKAHEEYRKARELPPTIEEIESVL